eukprot:Sdes_comp19599_c0_seq2m11328
MISSQLILMASKIAKNLIKFHANVNSQDSTRSTPLHRACARNQLSLVHLLAQNEADLNLQDCEGNTPLHIACMEGNVEIAQILIEKYKAKIDIENKEKKTPAQVC